MFLTDDQNLIKSDLLHQGSHQWGLIELGAQRMFYLAQFEAQTADGNGGWRTSSRTAMTFEFSAFEPYLNAAQDGLRLTDLYCVCPSQRKNGLSGWEMSRVVEVLSGAEVSVPESQSINVFVTKNGKKWSDSYASQEARHLLIGAVKYSLPK